MSHHLNTTRIKAVYYALGDLKDKVVFVGGAIVSLYADTKSEEVRPTDYIDIVVEIWAYLEYSAVDEQFRQLGFVNDQTSGIVCRYSIQGLIVDLMPTQGNVLGFSNKWFHPSQKVKKTTAGYLFEFKCGINRELISWMGKWLGEIQIIEPEKLKTIFIKKMEETKKQMHGG